MTKSLADLETELKDAEAQLALETDPTQVAVLAGRIIELKSDISFEDPAPAADPAWAQSTAPAPVKAMAAPVQEQPAPAAPAAPVKAASAAAPAPKPTPAPAPKPTPAPAPAPATRTGIDPSTLPIALRPTRN